jgi:hypothetical protein
MGSRDARLLSDAADELKVVSALLATFDGAAPNGAAQQRNCLVHAAALTALAIAYREHLGSLVDEVARDLVPIAREVLRDGPGRRA